MSEDKAHLFESWSTRSAGVPRGLLKFYVLKALNQKPKSGSEILEEIQRETGGRWKPSPGSIYPLLAWLEDRGYARRLLKHKSGLKRYALTDHGREFLKKQAKFGENLRRKLEFLAPALVGGFQLESNSEALREIRKPVWRFVTAFLNLRLHLTKDVPREVVEEITEILTLSTEKIEGLAEKLRKGGES